jgi:hypothetical protein
MKQLRFFFILLIMMSFNPVFAQTADDAKLKDEKSVNENKHIIGANVGSTTGVGLTYGYWFGKNAIQLTALPLYSKDEYSYFSFGLAYKLKLKKITNRSDVIAYTGHTINNIFEAGDWAYNAGLGFGIQYLENSIGVNLMAGYAAYNINIEDRFMVLPAFEASLFYYF